MSIATLHPLEIKILRGMSEQVFSATDAEKLGLNIGQINQATSWLLGREFIREVDRRLLMSFELTDLGREEQRVGMPAEQIIAAIKEHGPKTLSEIMELQGMSQQDAGKAFGRLKKDGVVEMDADKRIALSGKDSAWIAGARALLDRAVAAADGLLSLESLSQEERSVMSDIAKKRGASSVAFREIEREIVRYEHTDAGRDAVIYLEEHGMTGDALGIVTPEMLANGSWKDKDFRPYSIDTPANRLLIGRTNAYADYIRWVKDKLVSLGFQEFDGPLVTNEFWNGDALFMPQFHSARDIHDVYYVKEPSHVEEIPEPWLSNVAAMHENGGDTPSRGWGYSFDREFTRRQLLRSQGTVLSATELHRAKVPGKYFGIARCFRYDRVDATHGADFYQTEGIVLGDEVNVRTLLGLLKTFAEEIAGAEEVRYVPGYFPFTEPSIEVHIKHPKLGWFELGGSGIFRPEVTKAMGIDVPVLAWGLGIDRMAMMHLGISDMRELFSQDIDAVRSRRKNSCQR